MPLCLWPGLALAASSEGLLVHLTGAFEGGRVFRFPPRAGCGPCLDSRRVFYHLLVTAGHTGTGGGVGRLIPSSSARLAHCLPICIFSHLTRGLAWSKHCTPLLQAHHIERTSSLSTPRIESHVNQLEMVTTEFAATEVESEVEECPQEKATKTKDNNAGVMTDEEEWLYHYMLTKCDEKAGPGGLQRVRSSNRGGQAPCFANGNTPQPRGKLFYSHHEQRP